MRRFPDWTVLAALVGVSSVVRAWAGAKVPGPWFIPDEVVYAELGRSLYRFGHFEILGRTPEFFGIVYPLFAGLPLHVAGVDRGYAILKPLQALAMSLAAVPVYVWGRSLVSRGWALAAAALTLCVPELALSGFLMTEVLFYPVFCLAAWAMARALVKPTLARQGILLGAILLAAMTRVQAVVLAPAFLLAGLIDVALARTWLRGLRRLMPALASIVLLALAWIGVTALHRGQVLGAYQVTAAAGYDPLEAFRFVVYHAADLVLATAVVPMVALIAIAVPAFEGRERSAEVRSFIAVTLALTLTFVAEVGVFSSRFTGRIAERNLIELFPLLFLSLVLWLHRGAPRPRLPIAAGSAAAVFLLLVTPWSRFVTPAAEPDAFTLVPFVELRQHHPGLGPAVTIGLVAAVLLALLALPRRLLAFIPLSAGILLAAASVSAGRLAASQARAYQDIMVGGDRRWIDKAAPGPTLFLYGGELSWSGGAPVWTNLFWNDRIEQVDELFGARIAGPIQAGRGFVTGDGRVVVVGQRRTVARYVVASKRLQLVGQPFAGSSTGLSLWRIDAPLRVVTRKDGVNPVTGALSMRARITAYGCRGGSVALALVSPDDRFVRLERNGVLAQELRLAGGARWSGSIPVPAPGRPGAAACTISLHGTLGVTAERLEFLPR